MNCARCGAANDPGMNFCINCGNSLLLQPPPPPSFNQPPPFAQPPAGYSQQRPLAAQPNLFNAYSQDIPNYLTQAILCTLFCCVPTGIVAIIYASQVNNKKQVGDLAGAAQASSKAQTWCWVSFGLGLIVLILNVIITISDIQ